MKLAVCVMLLIGAVSCNTMTYFNPVLDLERISRMTPVELDQLAGGLAAEEIIRTKRSGSGDILGQVAKKISSGISGKISALGQASAGASSFLSGGSSKGHDEHAGYEYEAPAVKPFDFWTLKKSILATLFEAVKAIVGGATIIKGQVIKGGGALAAGLGKAISVKGDAVTNLGRHLVQTAWLAPPKKHRVEPVHHAEVHITAPAVVHSAPSAPAHPAASYGPPIGSSVHYQQSQGHVAQYEAPSAPSAQAYYGPPPQPNAIYGPPSKYSAPLEGHGKFQSAPLAGVFLLKPLDTSYDSHVSPPGPPASFVSSAMHALKGILGTSTSLVSQVHSSPPSAHESSPSSSATGPSGPSGPSHQADPLFHPPPPIPAHANSYNSFSSHDLPPFKPLDIPTGGANDHFESSVNSYGLPVSHDSSTHTKLQSMVDSLLGEYPISGTSFKTYAPSYSDTKTSHSSPVFTWKKHGLSPVKLSKVTANLDKIKLDRSDRARSALDPLGLYEQMALAKEEAVRETEIEKDVNEKNNKSVTTEKTKESKEHSIRESGAVTSIEKAITYELRGNKIVRLTDKTTDV